MGLGFPPFNKPSNNNNQLPGMDNWAPGLMWYDLADYPSDPNSVGLGPSGGPDAGTTGNDYTPPVTTANSVFNTDASGTATDAMAQQTADETGSPTPGLSDTPTQNDGSDQNIVGTPTGNTDTGVSPSSLYGFGSGNEPYGAAPGSSYGNDEGVATTDPSQGMYGLNGNGGIPTDSGNPWQYVGNYGTGGGPMSYGGGQGGLYFT